MTSTLILEDDFHSQDVPNSCAGIQPDDDIENFDGFDNEHDDEGETSYSEESEDDESDNEGRATTPEIDTMM